jgi:hypothetical protein
MRGMALALLLASCGSERSGAERPAAPAFPVRCPQCRLLSGRAHVCSLTRWCSWCARDAGEGHRCDHTGFCPTCHRETGKGHVCGATELCPRPVCRNEDRPLEHAPVHVCGESTFCPSCLEEAGPEHSCRERTYFCPRCGVDATPQHACDRSRFCASCRRERSVPGPHDCGHTRYCPECGRDAPYRHVHSGLPEVPSLKTLDFAPRPGRLQ